MKMKVLFILFILFAQLNSYAQNGFIPANNNMQILTTSKTPDEHTGTPYMDDDFKKGVVKYTDGKQHDAFLRYNAVEGKMEIKINLQEEKIYTLPLKKGTQYFIDDEKYFLDSFKTTEGRNLSGYFIDYFSGDNIKLLGFPNPDITPAKKATTGYQKDKPANLDVHLEFYIRLKDKPLQFVKLKPKDFKNILGDSSKMKDFFSDNKVRSLEDAIKAVKYYDNLD